MYKFTCPKDQHKSSSLKVPRFYLEIHLLTSKHLWRGKGRGLLRHSRDGGAGGNHFYILPLPWWCWQEHAGPELYASTLKLAARLRPMLFHYLAKASRHMQCTQMLSNHLALVDRRAWVPGFQRTIIIRETVIGRQPPTKQCTNSRMKHIPSFSVKKKGSFTFLRSSA